MSKKKKTEQEKRQEQREQREKEREIQEEINACKQLLAQSDYKALKFAEGQISEEDYESVRSERQELRDRVNELEAEMESAKE